MKNYSELARLTKQERFLEIFEYVTKELKNEVAVDIMKNTLFGLKLEVKWEEAETISELYAKGFLNDVESDCLIQMCINNGN